MFGQESSIVNFYGTLAQINAEKILPVFEKRYPGVKVSQLDVTSDQLVTRGQRKLVREKR